VTTVGWGGMREYSGGGVSDYSGGWGRVSEYSVEYGEGELSTASKRLVNIMLAWIHGYTPAISVCCKHTIL